MMKTPRRTIVARALGLTAVLSTLVFIWTGWWQLAISSFLAAAAALLTPRVGRGAHVGPVRRTLTAVGRRLHPHSWRPGNR